MSTKNYKVICVSIYNQDLTNADGLVGELKAQGYSMSNRSWLIRQALAQFDVTKLPPFTEFMITASEDKEVSPEEAMEGGNGI